MHSLVFGCGTKHNDDVTQSNGVFGLSGAAASLLASISSKFSYCLGSIRDPLDPYHFLIMGDDAFTGGFRTPSHLSAASLYFVTLESISVDYQKNITANPWAYEFSVLLDSGSSLTYLTPSVYRPMKSKIMAKLDKSGLHVVPPPARAKLLDSLCYEGSLDSDLPDILVALYLPGIIIDSDLSDQ